MTTTPPIHLDLIDQARIASPCSMRWEDMEGDGAVRHCRDCDLDVHNFSDMTRDEVEDLLRRSEGRLCATFYRRADGTILTRDCPVGLRAARIRAARMVGRVAAALGLLLTGGAIFGRAGDGGADAGLRSIQPFARIAEWIAPTRPAVLPPRALGRMAMGEIMVVPSTRSTPTAAPPPGPCGTPGADGGEG